MGGAPGSPSTMEYTGEITIDATTVLKFLAQSTDGTNSAEQLEGYVLIDSPIRAEWAMSGHGDIAAEAWRHWDGDIEQVCDSGLKKGLACDPEVLLSCTCEEGCEGATCVSAFLVQSSCARCHGGEATQPPPTRPFAGLLEYAQTGENTRAAPLALGLDCVNCHEKFPSIYADLATGTVQDSSPWSSPPEEELSLYSASNICMACHQGRESGEDVKDRDRQ